MVGSRVYVGGLPYGVRERDLEKFFKGFGRTRDILIKNGYGFVEFEDYRDADDAVYELNGKDLLGERVVVEPARGTDRGDRSRRDRDRYRDPPHRGRYDDSHNRYGPPTRTEYRLIVENLSSRISWQDLKDYMRQAGEVTYADAHKQHRNEGGRGQSKSSSSNTGVVEFATSSDMRAALEKLDNTELNGRRIRLVEDRRSSRRRSRSSSRSRSRSRSRRRTRSRSRSRRSSRSRSRSKSKPKKSSKSPAVKSRSRDKSPAAKADRGSSRSRSRSPVRRSRSKSPVHHSRSKSPVRRSRSKSPVRRSRSKSPVRRSRSAVKESSRSRSRSRNSRIRSESRERSCSRTKDGSPKRADERRRSKSASRSRSVSASPRRNGTGGQRASGDRDDSPRSGD